MNSCALGADGELLQADEPADAVVDVDDVVADLEVAEVGEERALGRRPAGGAARSRRTRSSSKTSLSATSVSLASARRTPAIAPVVTRHHRGARTSAASTGSAEDVVLAQQLDRALGAAGRFGDEQRRLAGFARLAQLGDPLVDAAVMPRTLWQAMARTGDRRRRPRAESSRVAWARAHRPSSRQGTAIASGGSTRRPRRVASA